MHRALLLLGAAAAAAQQPPIELFPGGAPGEVAGFCGPEAHEIGDDGTMRYYNVSVPTLTYVRRADVSRTSRAPPRPPRGDESRRRRGRDAN